MPWAALFDLTCGASFLASRLLCNVPDLYAYCHAITNLLNVTLYCRFRACGTRILVAIMSLVNVHLLLLVETLNVSIHEKNESLVSIAT